jgi:RecJ-like exonuclease
VLIEKIKESIVKIDILSGQKPIQVISHHDTDGITSAAIFSRALQRWNKKFSTHIVKNLDKEYIDKLPENKVLIFLDLASGSLDYLKDKKTEVFILDHHEIAQEIPSNVTMLNPLLYEEEVCSGAALAYLFARELAHTNKDLASLAVLGMIGDMFDTNIGKRYDSILKDAEVTVRKGLILYPSTRPLDRALEYSTSLYIPGVTGSFKGVMELLRDAGITKSPTGYKSLAELTEEEMSKLITAIMLRKIGDGVANDIIGNMYLIKFFNKVEDARELSATVNACSRMGYPEAALGFCLGNKEAKKETEKIYVTYKQNIASALKYLSETEKITGKNYTIINAQDKIKDTIIGTAASIMSFSPLYPEGTVIIAMAYDQDKIKVSARLAGRKGRNVREILTKAVIPFQGEVGGHPNAAGALISRQQESEFIKSLQEVLEIDLIKV